jgi:D-alanyl-lipoteichoic acid acyltransferase DltB (MBOAT superfamily)
VGYYLLKSSSLSNFSNLFLVAASLIFYSWWNIAYLPLILFSIVFNYFAAYYINDSSNVFFSKKFIYIVSVIANVTLLFYFKYVDFFIENTNLLLSTEFSLLNIALPLAISFFTLQQIAFLTDCYEGLSEENRFFDYALFVSFFPQLIAGPIVHHKEMMPQFINNSNQVINYRNLSIGLFVFCSGLFKKVVIADSFAVWASDGYSNISILTVYDSWVASLSYSMQLYFDFSGYCDMAIGIALMFNIMLPINFNSPFKATGMIDFWKRWHITLTRFITTYIYTPLIRMLPRVTFNGAMAVTIISFMIAGLWHGASWTFVIFGTLNGIGIAVNHVWQKKIKKILKLNVLPLIGWFITFNYVNITFVFFRSENVADAVMMISKMYYGLFKAIVNIFSSSVPSQIDWTSMFYPIYAFVPLVATILFTTISLNNNNLISTIRFDWKLLILCIFFFCSSVMMLTSFSEFLYFNF